jgi:CubicO group peptidase (beta-lactamase class C family)
MMRSVPPALALATLLAACASAPESAPAAAPDPSAALPILNDSSVLDAMQRAHVPGLAIAYLRDCRVERVATYGVTDAESGVPVSERTLFEAASLSKPVFSYLLLQLAEAGRIDLDAPIHRALDYPRIRDRERYAMATPRLALSHAIGFPNWAGAPRDWERSDALEFAFAPGSAFRYSGEGYQLAQHYTEQVTGQTLEELFRAALGEVMPGSIFGGAVPADAPAASGHDGTGSRARAIGDWPRANAAYTLRTTVADYASFLARICAGEGLGRAVHAELLRPRIGLVGDERGADPAAIEAELGWALGWGVQTTGERTLHFHWGDNGAFRAFVALDAAAGRGVVYFANGERGLELMETLATPVVGSVRSIAAWLNY